MGKRFIILVATISIAGFSQGLLLPLLSILLEKQGISSTFNGLSAASLYIGMLIVSPFMEGPVRKFGYKPMIITGMSLLIGATILFPVWQNVYFWIFLRLLVGIGDNALHFATQVWITSTVPPDKRGRSISIYGLAFGVGFGIGPLGVLLLPYGIGVPFAVAGALFLLILIPILRLENDFPEVFQQTEEKRYLQVYSIAAIAFIPIFIYGVLEGTLNTTFPIFGLRTGLGVETVPKLLSAFVIGSLALQLPLGTLSDYIGRRKVLMISTLVGGILFSIVPFLDSKLAYFVVFALAGGFVGSLYSLSLAFIADLVSPSLLPAANILATIHFVVGSILGPYLGGIMIDIFPPQNLFYMIGTIVLSFSILGFFQREKAVDY